MIYSYGLSIENPSSLVFHQVLVVNSPEQSAMVNHKGSLFVLLGVFSQQFVGPWFTAQTGPFNSAFSQQFATNTPLGYLGIQVNKLLASVDASVAHLTRSTSTLHFPATLGASSGQSSKVTLRTLAKALLSALTTQATASPLSKPNHAIIAAISPNAGGVRRKIGKFVRLTPNPFSSDLSSDFGAGPSMISSLVRTLGHGFFITSSPEVAGLSRGAGLRKATASSSLVNFLKGSGRVALATHSVVVSSVPRSIGRTLALVNAELAQIVRGQPLRLNAATPDVGRVTFGGGNLFARVFGTPTAEFVGLLRAQSVQRGGASSSTAGATKALGRLFSGVNASASFLLKLSAVLRSAASPTVTASQRQAGLARRTFSASAQALLQAGAHVGNAFSVVSGQSAGMFQQHVLGRSLLIQRLQSSAVSISSVRSLARLLSAASPQAGSLARAMARSMVAASAAAQTVARSTGKLFGAASTGVAKSLTIALHALAFLVASAQAVAQRASHARGLPLSEAQIAHLVARHGSFLSALVGSAVSVQIGLVKLLAAAVTQAANRVVTVSRSFFVLSGETVTSIRGLYRFPSVLSPQVVFLVARHGSSFAGAINAQTAALGRSTSKIVAWVSRQVVAAGRIDRRILGAISTNVASLLRPRGLALLASQTQITKVVHWYHLFVAPWAYQQTSLLPPGGGPAEPPSFGVIDPLDLTTFGFDWASRSYPNDPILSAVVVSVPAGMTLIGPVFVSGTLVQATVAPFTPPTGLPATYTLRCTCTFASGRVSSFSIPVPIRTL